MQHSPCKRAPSPGRQRFHPGIAPVADCRRTGNERINRAETTPDSNELAKIPFGATWENIMPDGFVPKPKNGQTILYCQEDKSIIFAYGHNEDDTFSSSFYQYSLNDNKWNPLTISNVTPRTGCGSVIVGRKIWFFGGSTKTSYVRDLHCVDLETKTAIYPETTGEIPPACAVPLLAYSHPNLIVWASMTGSNPSSFHVLNTETYVWKEIPTDHVYRQGAYGTVIDDTMYVIGSSCPNTVLAIDLKEFTFKVVHTVGDEPPGGFDGLTTTAVVKSLLCVPKAGEGALTNAYTFDSERTSWSSYSIGLGGAVGLPVKIFYIDEERIVILILSDPEEASFRICKLQIGRAMAKINHRIDLVSLLKLYK